MLEISNLYKSFKENEILRNISVEMGEGVYGILGPNGAGKTTLLRCIVRLYKADKGSIKYNGENIDSNEEFMKNFGYLPQKFGLFKELSVRENLCYFGTLKKINGADMERSVKECLTMVNLEDRVDCRVSALSGGMIRRLGIAQALLGNSRILVFDEPTAGLDPEERMRFKNILREVRKNRLIIISTHIVEDVEACCDKILIMDKGKIFKLGTSEEIRSFAEGKVYEIEQANYEVGLIAGRYDRNGKSYMRVLSNKNLKHKVLKPSLEDGYMCIVKGV